MVCFTMTILTLTFAHTLSLFCLLYILCTKAKASTVKGRIHYQYQKVARNNGRRNLLHSKTIKRIMDIVTFLLAHHSAIGYLGRETSIVGSVPRKVMNLILMNSADDLSNSKALVSSLLLGFVSPVSNEDSVCEHFGGLLSIK